MVPVYNTTLNRSLCPDDVLILKYGEFFNGWSKASKRITPEETYLEVDRLKPRGVLDSEVGELFGRVMSFQGLVFLCAEFKVPDVLFQELINSYE